MIRRKNYESEDDHAHPLALRPSKKITIDWETPLEIGTPDVDVRLRLGEATERAFQTLEAVIDQLDRNHNELSDINSKYDGEKLRQIAKELSQAIGEGIADYDFTRYRYQRLIHFCDQNNVAYALPRLRTDDVELFHEKTGSINFSREISIDKMIFLFGKLLEEK